MRLWTTTINWQFMVKQQATKTKVGVPRAAPTDSRDSGVSLFDVCFVLFFVIVFLVWCSPGKTARGRRNRKKHDYVVSSIRPNGTKVYEHREIAASVLGRILYPGEVVHHINFKKADNRVENLCVMNETAHLAYHDWHTWIVKKYGRHPRTETQHRKLRESFGGILLADVVAQRSRPIPRRG